VSPLPASPAVPAPRIIEDDDLEPVDDDEGYAPCEDPSLKTAETLSVPPPTSIEQLTNSDGQYIDEIVNHALQLFGGRILV
jgi:hypothetical protein